jgi:hypothetical protein
LVLGPNDAAAANVASPRELDELGPRVLDELGPRELDELGPRVLDELGPRELDELGPRVLDELGPRELDELDELGPRELDELDELDELGPRELDELGPRELDELDELGPRELDELGPRELDELDELGSRELGLDDVVAQPSEDLLVLGVFDRLDPDGAALRERLPSFVLERLFVFLSFACSLFKEELDDLGPLELGLDIVDQPSEDLLVLDVFDRLDPDGAALRERLRLPRFVLERLRLLSVAFSLFKEALDDLGPLELGPDDVVAQPSEE